MGFSVTVPAGCGEFLQGRVGNRSVIISTPVNAYVKAIVNDGIYDEKLLGKKSRQAVQRADSICGGSPFDKVLEIMTLLLPTRPCKNSPQPAGTVTENPILTPTNKHKT